MRNRFQPRPNATFHPFLRTPFRSLSAAAAALLLGSCASVNPYYDASRPHHRQNGFQNNYTAFEPRGLRDLVRWRYAAWRDELPQPPRGETPRTTPDLAFIRANATAGTTMQPTATWIGHATVLVQMGGLNVLTDPIFSERASPLGFVGPKRHQPPGVALAQLPHIDLVLISHNHYDHLDEATVRALNAQFGGPPLFVVPLGVKPWLADIGITNAVELDWWQSHELKTGHGAAEVVMTPVQHWSGRGLTDRMKTLWGGYAVFTPGFQIFHAGDTGYSKDFADIQQRFAARQDASRGGGFDLALIPVGAYEPRWFMAQQHIDPTEAVRIHADLGAKHSLGIHWGTFELTDESLDAPPPQLAEARRAKGVADESFFVMAIGETRRFEPRPPN